MMIGVIHASWAPASRRVATAWASDSPVASSTLASRRVTGWLARGWPSAAAVPITTWVAFGIPSMSRLPVADPVRQAGFLDEADDVGVGADHTGLPGVDDGVGGLDPGPEHRFRLQFPTGQRELLEDGDDVIGVGPGVDEAAEGHVAGDACE